MIHIKHLIIALPAFCLVSCLDFDSPGDEFVGNQTVANPTIFSGNADKLEFNKEITQEAFYKSYEELNNNACFQYLQTAQYYLRGGKDGNMPGPHQYQYVYNLHIDNYAGYFVANQNFQGRMPSCYYYNQDFCSGPYGAYMSVKKYVCNTLNNPEIDNIPEMKAIALLIYDYCAAEMVDIYGSIPYQDHKNNKETDPFEYQPAENIYASIIQNIDDISACLDHFEQRPDWYKEEINMVLMMYDAITQPDEMGYKSITNWKRMAQSLKLRMAMHCVKVRPDLAQKWAEEAVAAGVVENTDQEIVLNTRNNFWDNPLGMITSSWNDSRLNAAFETLLMSLNHPYTKYVFSKNIADIVNVNNPTKVLPAGSRIVGLRAGIEMKEGQTVDVNSRCAYSRFVEDDGSEEGFKIALAPLYFIKLSEMQFLRAEGALRGWNMGGTAKEFYEAGIRSAQIEERYFAEQTYTKYVDEYMQLKEAIDYTYVDPEDEENNAKSLTTIGVKWNEADDMETKLEKIITQKYIALFPYANEAWTELRRTGYPKLLPVLNASDYSDGSLEDGDLIRRIPFPYRDLTAGQENIANSGIPSLGGPDEQGTRIWWDIEGSNF